MSVRGRGLPGAIFRGSRLPLTPRTNTGPYVRPSGPMRLPPSQPGRLINVQANSRSSGNDHLHPLTRTNTDDNDQRPKPTLGEILDEVRRGRDDQMKVRDDLKRMSQLIAKLEEEYRKLNEQFKQADATSVESSVYKVIIKFTALIINSI